jgi:uncharacterized protein with LGFP repeats
VRRDPNHLGYSRLRTGKLGYPVANEICGLAHGGCYLGFQGGTIHYAPGVGAHGTSGPIRAIWALPRLRGRLAELADFCA